MVGRTGVPALRRRRSDGVVPHLYPPAVVLRVGACLLYCALSEDRTPARRSCPRRMACQRCDIIPGGDDALLRSDMHNLARARHRA